MRRSSLLKTDDRLYAGKFGIHQSCWVSGTRAVAYFGSVVGESWTGNVERLDKALLGAIAGAVKTSTKMSDGKANSLVCLEIDIDPWHKLKNGREVVIIRASGTAACLAPLY